MHLQSAVKHTGLLHGPISPLTILHTFQFDLQLAFVEAADDGTVEEMSNAKAISVRFGIMAVVAVVAALSFQVLGSVESIVGAVCSMSSSMLLPGFFFLR